MTMGAEGTIRCPFDSKNFLNESRISFAVMLYFDFYMNILLENCCKDNLFCVFLQSFCSQKGIKSLFMALNINKNLKTYYSIGEVAHQFGVSETLLRYWEKEFPSIKPKKANRNIRQYSQDDIDEIRLIYNLTKVQGMKIAAAREVLSKNRAGVSDKVQAIEKLMSIREELVSIRKELGEL